MAVRPSKLTPELSSEICRRLAEPEDETFAPQYARAREIGYHASFDLIVDVADMPQIETSAARQMRSSWPAAWLRSVPSIPCCRVPVRSMPT
jgi:hypothetical protein